MANKEHVALLRQGAKKWNGWRRDNPYVIPDLEGADLSATDLSEVDLVGVLLNQVDFHEAILHRAAMSRAAFIGSNFSKAVVTGTDLSQGFLMNVDFTGANITEANLWSSFLNGACFNKATLRRTDLRNADLSGADLTDADLSGAFCNSANFIGARLTRANLSGADVSMVSFHQADLTEANLSGADLTQAVMVEANLEQAVLTGCAIYGLSVWSLQGSPRSQDKLIITRAGESVVTVDDLEVAQFIHLLLNREKLRNVITTITSKAVLILGRFTPERKVVLNGIADELRKYNLLPVIFDFERSVTRDFTETIKTLAGMSFFVIADITNPKSAPLELQATMPDYQIPFVTIIQKGEKPFSMFSDLSKYDWVLKPVVEYSSVDILLKGFKQAIIDRAWNKHQELQRKKLEEVEVLSVETFMAKDQG